MAFDIASAVPIDDKKKMGFDLASAVPVEPQGPIKNPDEPNARLAEMPPEQSIGNSAWQDIKNNTVGAVKGIGQGVEGAINIFNPIPSQNTGYQFGKYLGGAIDKGVLGKDVANATSATLGPIADWVNKIVSPIPALGLKEGGKQV